MTRSFKFLQCLMTSYILFEISVIGQLSESDAAPTFKSFDIDDRNDQFDVIYLSADPTIRIYFSRSTNEPKNNRIYSYFKISNNFEKIDLKFEEKEVIVDEIIPVNNKFFCVSYQNEIAFFMEQDFKKSNVSKINSNYRYIPHPLYHRLVARYPKSFSGSFSVDISINFGHTYDAHKTEDVKKFEWFEIYESAVLLTESNIKILKLENIPKIVVLMDRCLEFQIFSNIIFMIQRQANVEAFLELHSFDGISETSSLFQFPKLYTLKNIEYVEYWFGVFYLAIKDQDDEICLWKTRKYNHKCIRIICHGKLTKNIDKKYFFINKRLEGVLLFNIYHLEQSLGTYQSHNDGRFWDLVNEKNTSQTLIQNNHLTFDFLSYDSRNIPDSFEWMDIQYAIENHSKKAYATLDNGLTWTPISSSSFAAVILNFGSPFVSISKKYGIVKYSTDELKTWKVIQALKESDIVMFSDRLYAHDLVICIASRSVLNDKLKFTIIDFSNIYKNTCRENDFYDWELSRVHGSCFQGQMIVYKRRKQNILCVDSELYHKKSVNFTCPCKPDDFGCAFNYHTSFGFCLLDKHSGITELPRICNEGTHFDFFQSGYVRVENDKCTLHSSSHKDSDEHSSDLCVENDWTNFMILFKNDEIYSSQIKSDGSPFRQQFFMKTHLKSFITDKDPIALDLIHNLLYKYADGSIQSVLRNDLEKNIFAFSQLYYFKTKIIKMHYEASSNLLIFLDLDNLLKGISLLTNFEFILARDVTSFMYSTTERYLFFVKSKNYACFLILFDVPLCRKMENNLKNVYGNFRQSRLFLHQSDKKLRVYNIENKNLDSIENIFEVLFVDNFYEYNDHLYMLINNSIIHQRVSLKELQIKLYKSDDIHQFIFHPASVEAFSELCAQKKCQFMCTVVSDNDIRCACPTSTIAKIPVCPCLHSQEDCLKPFCHGFYCKNTKCLINNVRCNGVDDCGDKSDEYDCKDLCQEGFHLCEGQCFPTSQACKIFVSYNENILDTSKKWNWYIILPLIIMGTIFIGYIFYKALLFRLDCFRNRKLHITNRIQQPLIIPDRSEEIERLLDHESD